MTFRGFPCSFISGRSNQWMYNKMNTFIKKSPNYSLFCWVEKKNLLFEKKYSKKIDKLFGACLSLVLPLGHTLNPQTMNKFLAMLMMSATLFVVACNNTTEEASTEQTPGEDEMPVGGDAPVDTAAAPADSTAQ